MGSEEILSLDLKTLFNIVPTRSILFGAIIGRYANRIANGTFTLYEVTYHTPLNDDDWDTIHGGTIGYDRRIWTVNSHSPNQLSLSYFSPDGEMGFPGNLQVSVVYTLTDDNELVIEYSGKAEKPTVINLTQHTYWNLNGFKNDTQTVLDHILYINADSYLLVDSHLIPTGEFGSVKTDYWMDFTTPTPIGTNIAKGTVTPSGGYDDAYILNPKGGTVRVQAPLTGISMELFTSQPSIQFYSGNYLNGSLPRKPDQAVAPNQYYQMWSALALETQHFPDSVHHPEWPTTTLNLDQTYNERSLYRFTVQ